MKDSGQQVGGYERTFRSDPGGRKETAEAWILALTESCLRQFVSETSAALIVSKRAVLPLPSSPGGVAGAVTPDVIADKVLERLRPKARRYGLEIDHLEVQQVELPAHIQKAVDNVWIASTTPIKSEHEARALRIRLEELAAVVGNDAVAANEIMKNFRGAYAYGSVPQMLQAVFAKLAPSLSPGSTSAPPPPLPSKAGASQAGREDNESGSVDEPPAAADDPATPSYWEAQ